MEETKPRIRAIGKQVLVQLEPLATQTAGGIHIPDSYRHHHMSRPDQRWGRVVSVGSRVREVAAGDRVLINGWLNDSAKHGEPGGRSDSDRTVFVSEDDVILREVAE